MAVGCQPYKAAWARALHGPCPVSRHVQNELNKLLLRGAYILFGEADVCMFCPALWLLVAA